MELINKTPNKIIFKAEVNESLANAIRRHVNHVSTLAIDEIEISKNGSSLFDETIAHRLGLVPLQMDSKFEKSSPKLTLQTKSEGIIYSGELKGPAKIVYDRIPITSLNKGQEIELTATTKVGIGEEHSKFNPGIIFYRNSSEISVEKDVAEEIKKSYPEIEMKESGNKNVVLDNKEKEIRDFVESVAEKKGKEAETKFGKDLIVTIESFGQLSVEDIFSKSISCLKKDLIDFQKKFK
jgi:DNA-directed RNA polymerase subunit D